MKIVMAIDPGLSGGLAVSWFGKAECYPMPETEGDLLALLQSLKAAGEVEGCQVVCVLEHVGGFPLLWRADREAALAYNRRDVEIEIEIARMCGCI